jgi:hypothetical protein
MRASPLHRQFDAQFLIAQSIPRTLFGANQQAIRWGRSDTTPMRFGSACRNNGAAGAGACGEITQGADAIKSDEIDAGILEAKLAEHLEKLAAGLAGGAADRADELLEETRRMSPEASGFGCFPAEAEQRDPQAIAEMLIEAYLEAAEVARTPSELHWLQDLAQRSIARLAWLTALA